MERGDEKSNTISDQCLYEQLSEDWRNRDRITWQLPAVLVVVGGLLLIGLFGRPCVDPLIKNSLLGVGLGFAWLLTIMLARNLYLQAVGDDLMETIRNVEKIKKGKRQVDEARRGARRVPLRRTKYGLRDMLKGPKPISTVLLLVLCASIVGLFTFLLSNSYPWWFAGYWWFLGGVLFSFLSVVGIVLCSHLKFKVN